MTLTTSKTRHTGVGRCPAENPLDSGIRRNDSVKRKKRTYQTGLMAEAICRAWLRVKGYRILAARYKTHAGEIDIIAKTARSVVFVEVKSRRSKEEGLHALSAHQQQRIVRAASLFMAAHPHYNTLAMRFDFMVIAPWRLPKHLPHAFEGV